MYEGLLIFELTIATIGFELLDYLLERDWSLLDRLELAYWILDFEGKKEEGRGEKYLSIYAAL